MQSSHSSTLTVYQLSLASHSGPLGQIHSHATWVVFSIYQKLLNDRREAKVSFVVRTT
jgi:hypothetical protein